MGEAARKRTKQAEPEEQVPEGVDLAPDGTVLLHVDGEVYRLRRPKVGEYRKLKERRSIVQDEALANLQKAAAAEPPPVKDEKDTAASLERALQQRTLQRAAGDANEQLERDWFAEVADMLCDRELPPQDEWPNWLGQADLAASLFQHWRTVPLASGAR